MQRSPGHHHNSATAHTRTEMIMDSLRFFMIRHLRFVIIAGIIGGIVLVAGAVQYMTVKDLSKQKKIDNSSAMPLPLNPGPQEYLTLRSFRIKGETQNNNIYVDKLASLGKPTPGGVYHAEIPQAVRRQQNGEYAYILPTSNTVKCVTNANTGGKNFLTERINFKYDEHCALVTKPPLLESQPNSAGYFSLTVPSGVPILTPIPGRLINGYQPLGIIKPNGFEALPYDGMFSFHFVGNKVIGFRSIEISNFFGENRYIYQNMIFPSPDPYRCVATGGGPMGDPCWWDGESAFVFLSEQSINPAEGWVQKNVMNDLGPVVWTGKPNGIRDAQMNRTGGGTHYHPNSFLDNGFMYLFTTYQGCYYAYRAPQQSATNPHAWTMMKYGVYGDKKSIPPNLSASTIGEHYSVGNPDGEPSCIFTDELSGVSNQYMSVAKIRGTSYYASVIQRPVRKPVRGEDLVLRISPDLIHWSKPATLKSATGGDVWGLIDYCYPTFVNERGETNMDIDPNNFFVLGNTCGAGKSYQHNVMNLSIDYSVANAPDYSKEYITSPSLQDPRAWSFWTATTQQVTGSFTSAGGTMRITPSTSALSGVFYQDISDAYELSGKTVKMEVQNTLTSGIFPSSENNPLFFVKATYSDGSEQILSASRISFSGQQPNSSVRKEAILTFPQDKELYKVRAHVSVSNTRVTTPTSITAGLFSLRIIPPPTPTPVRNYTFSFTQQTTGGTPAPNTQFSYTITCRPPATGTQTTVTQPAGATYANTYSPDTSCDVVQNAPLPPAPAGYAWGTAEYDSIETEVNGLRSKSVTISNPLILVGATPQPNTTPPPANQTRISITNQVQPAIPLSSSFSYRYSCTNSQYNQQVTVAANTGHTKTVPSGVRCSIQQTNRPTAPQGYRWTQERIEPQIDEVTDPATGSLSISYLFINDLSSQPTPTPFCTDLDGGQVYNVKGAISASNLTTPTTDVCLGIGRLREWYCQNKTAQNTIVTCAQYQPGTSCVDGACTPIGAPPAVPKTTFPTPTTAQGRRGSILPPVIQSLWDAVTR